MCALGRKLSVFLRPGSRVACLTFRLPVEESDSNGTRVTASIELLHTLQLSMSWGLATCYIYQKSYTMRSLRTNIYLINENENDRRVIIVLKEIQTITRKIKGDEEDEEMSLDWKFAAMVIDRLCLIFFSM